MNEPTSNNAPDRPQPSAPLRVLVVLPSWLGDAVMATPALALIRSRLRGSFIGALARPGLDELLAGSGLIDEFHVERSRGVMGPKVIAARVRPRRYDAALLLTNSFSTALITRLAFIPRRVGYDRDGRGLLLTQRLRPPLRSDDDTRLIPGVVRATQHSHRREHGASESVLAHSGKYALISAVDYYLHAARHFLGFSSAAAPSADVDAAPRMALGITDDQRQAALSVLERAGIARGEAYAILNPGANNPAKRWPAARFAEAGRDLAARGLRVLVNGSPGEAELVQQVTDLINGDNRPSRAARAVALTPLGMSIGALKGLLAGVQGGGGDGANPCRVLVTNDTGPRHIAAAFGVPTVTLFGPTDPRWTTLPPGQHPFENIVADSSLPEHEIADDHPERCAIDRIGVERVLDALRRLGC